MFRRIYWVTEHVFSDGRSEVQGVYTSIPDLIRLGLNRAEGVRLRLNLVKLDCGNGPFGTWEEPNFEGLSDQLESFVRTEEFSAEQVKTLLRTLQTEAKAA